MKRLFDFYCHDCGEMFEKLVDTNQKKVECYCGAMADRQVSMPRVALDGISGDFPGAADRWANIREQRAKVLRKKSWYEG